MTYGYLLQFLSQSLKLVRQTGIRSRTFAQTIERLTEAGQVAAQPLAVVGQGQVVFMRDQERSDAI